MRILKNPRVYIYCIVTIAVYCFLSWHQRVLERTKHEAGTQAPVVVQPEIVRQKPVGKSAEMVADASADLPKLYIFGDETQVNYAASLRQKLSGKCGLLHVVGSDAEMREYFKIKELPTAILFSPENEEIGRFEPPISEDTLEKEVLKKLK